jgi:hypothetical protein
MLGCGFMAWSIVGLYLSDAAESKLGLQPTAAEKERLRKAIPRIRTVDPDGISSDTGK